MRAHRGVTMHLQILSKKKTAEHQTSAQLFACPAAGNWVLDWPRGISILPTPSLPLNPEDAALIDFFDPPSP